MKKVGVILSGCGVFDGAEIHESVLTLLALERAGLRAVCMAPDKPQAHVINHLTGQVAEGECRNVLVEAARIARGDIENLATVKADDVAALILPGGFGAAKNLSRFAFEGAASPVDPEVSRLLREVFEAGKPIGLICIAPVIGAQVLGRAGIEVTIGQDPPTAAAIESCGARHVVCGVREVHEDAARKILSTPAYMLGQNLVEVSAGIEALVQKLKEWLA
jgi:enhancing lycopene biosynthesis protein 2